MNTHHILLPENIRTKITERNKIRKENSKDSQLPELNKNINKLIQTNKTQLWKNKLEQSWDHKQNTHTLWNTISNMANKKPKQQLNRTITFNNKTSITPKEIATNFNKQFTNSTVYSTNKENRKINKTTQKLKPENNLEITENEVRKAIQTSKNNKSVGPDNINIQHLKHLGPIAIKFLTKLYNLSLLHNPPYSIMKYPLSGN